MNLLTYVHLRNIYRSTGVGRVGRELTEHLAQRPEIRLRILADRRDHAKIVPRVGAPWTGFDYTFFNNDTSRQQMLWYLLDRPAAEDYWPETEVVYCTAESYVPTRRARLAVATHDMQLFEPEAHPPSRWLFQQRFKWGRLFNRLRRRAAMFHVISQFSADRMAHYFPGVESRVRVIPNAVSASFFDPPAPEGREVLNTLGLTARPYIVVPGGLHFRKNADLILQSWPQIHTKNRDLRLVIMGHNDPAYLPRANALPGLTVTGFLEESQLIALYESAQIAWFPSKYEGFGMPVLEAMACGTPVVTSNTTAIPEVAGDAAAALLPPELPSAHIDTILDLVQNPDARARASERGIARASQFTWQRSAEILAKALAELI